MRPPQARSGSRAATGRRSRRRSWIKGAANEGEGVAAERTYVVLRHPDWDPREIDTALMEDNGRTYDLSRFRGRDGVQHALYFDISEFFGKF